MNFGSGPLAPRPKVLGCGTRWDKAGTDAGQTPVFAGFFRGADGRRGLKTFGWRFPPIRRFSRGGGRVLPPWKIVFDGLLGDPLEPARAPE